MSHRLAAALLCLLPSAALADSLPEGLTFSGESRLELLAGSDFQTLSVLGKMAISYRLPGAGPLRYGLDLGWQSWSLRNEHGEGGDIRALHLEGVVEGSFGSLAIGQTRSATEMVIALPPIAGSGSEENHLAAATGPGLQRELLRGGYNPGLRYQTGLAGGVLVASVNHLEGHGNVAQLAASLPLGKTTLQAAAEYDAPTTAVSVLLGAKAQFGAVDAGIYHFSDGYYGTGGGTRLFATYHLSEQVEGNLTLLTVGDVTLSGLDVQYTTARGLFGQAGVLTSSDSPDPVLSLTAGMSF